MMRIQQQNEKASRSDSVDGTASLIFVNHWLTLTQNDIHVFDRDWSEFESRILAQSLGSRLLRPPEPSAASSPPSRPPPVSSTSMRSGAV